MQINKLSPDTPLMGLENSKLIDFWSWAYSDVLVNTNRSVLAEFIVGRVLGVVDKPRIEWDGCDLYYRGKKIEVKCSAYIQSWHKEEDKFSHIIFDIAKKFAWDHETNTYTTERVRIADCYVFCHYTEKKRVSANILNMDLWDFYVVNTALLDETLNDQKSIGLAALIKLCKPVKIDQLKESIDIALRLLPKSAD